MNILKGDLLDWLTECDNIGCLMTQQSQFGAAGLEDSWRAAGS